MASRPHQPRSRGGVTQERGLVAAAARGYVAEWRAGDGGFTMPVVGGEPAGGVVVGLLGPVEIGSAGGAMTPVAQPRLRVLLGLLAVAAGRVVSAESLVEGVWGEDWSPAREKNLHALVYQLRRRLTELEPE